MLEQLEEMMDLLGHQYGHLSIEIRKLAENREEIEGNMSHVINKEDERGKEDTSQTVVAPRSNHWETTPSILVKHESNFDG